MSAIAAPAAPFRGLAPFGDSDVDALLFFGRDREREVIVANLLASRLTVLYGPSGVGKSSLLQAGVAHRLRAEGLVVETVSSWVDDPPPDLLAGDAERYVILDQFEEYFLYHDGRTDALALDLPDALSRRGGPHVLLSLREDALARLDAFKPRVPTLFSNSLRLDRLTRDAARAAVLGPISRWNEVVAADARVSVEPDLVQAVLDEVEAADGGVETPYLQLVLQRLWSEEAERGSRTLRLSTLRELGGADSIVRTHLEDALDRLDSGQKDVAARVFEHLVTPSGMKIAHNAADLAGYAAVDESALAPVLRSLGRERILRPVGGDGAASDRYEIFHDVLADAVLDWRTRRDLERQREDAERRQRRIVFIAATAVVALAVVGGLAVFAFLERSHARADARRAHARELNADALQELDVDPRRSIVDALAAARLEKTIAVETVLRRSLATSRLRGVLVGGRLGIGSAVFDPDERRVASAGADGTARIFDVRTQTPLLVLHHGAAVTRAAFERGGILMTASADGKVRFWRGGRVVRTFTAGAPLADAAASPDGARVAAAGSDGRAWLWRVRDGRLVAVLHHPRRVLHVLFGASGRRLVTLDYDRHARLWNARNGRLVGVLVHSGFVNGAAFSPDGRLVATVGQEGVAKIWRAGDAHAVRTLRDIENPLSAVAFSPNGKILATAGADAVARLYEVRSGALLGIASAHTGAITDLGFSADSKLLLTGSEDRTARMWSADPIEAGRPFGALRAHGGAVTSAVFSSDGRRVLTASADGRARLWSSGVEPELGVLGRFAPSATVADISPDGTLVAASAGAGTVRVWTRSGRPVESFDSAGGAVAALRFSPDARTLDVVHAGGGIDVRRVRDGTVVARADLRAPVVAIARGASAGELVVATPRSIARVRAGVPARLAEATGVTSLDAHGDLIAAGGTDGTVRLFRGGHVVHVLRGHSGGIVSVAFSADGRRLVTASTDRTAAVWDSASGARLRVLRGHRAALTSARFSPDGRHVVTASKDADARVWVTETGRSSSLLHGHFHFVSDASFSPDGRWILTTGPRTLGLWSAASGALFSPSIEFSPFLRGPSPTITTTLWGPDSQLIVAASSDGTVRRYECALCAPLPRLVALAQARLRATAPRR